MAYERYIKKGGKIYGPYIQHNKKVDGKVVTEYRGKSGSSVKKSNNAKFFLFGLPGLILIFSLMTFVNFDLTGKVSLDVKSNYVEGETLDGNLKFSLKEGELIPADSKIVLEIGGNVQGYLLSDFITLSSVDGFFYAEDTELSGEGSGYGLIGSKKIYPEVSFELEIVEEGVETGGTSGGEVIEEPAPKDVSQGGTSSSSSPSLDEDVNTEGKEISVPSESETPTETASEEQAGTETTAKETKKEEKTEKKSEEKIKSEEGKIKNKEEKKSSENTEESSSSESETSSESSESPSESSSESSSGSILTGEVISENVISGVVSKDNDFEYNLDEGKIAEVVEGSVKVGDEKISESELKVKSKKGAVVVSTEYYYEEEGFGEEYSGKKKLKFDINLNEFDLVVGKDAMFTIRLVSGDVVIVEASKDLSVVEIEEPEEEVEINETEIEIIINETELEEIIVNEAINFTDILLDINTTQYGAVLGKPVKWKKNVKLEKEGKVNVELPKQAENITV